MILRILSLLMFPALTSGATAYGPELQGFEYPYAVARFEFSSQREQMHMAYMDVRPQQANGRAVVLLHGKNYCAATWRTTIQTLVAAGYRVIAPDQIGFCKPPKPQHTSTAFSNWRGTPTRYWS